MANVQIKYGYEHGKLALRTARPYTPCDPPKFGVVLDVVSRYAIVTAHARGLEHATYEGPASSLPRDWKAQAMAAVDALDDAWAVEP
jgi:hypothetical protein